jgi:hypothetical protein
MIDARTTQAHLLRDDALNTGHRGQGRYIALCGADVLPADLPAPTHGYCRSCAEAARWPRRPDERVSALDERDRSSAENLHELVSGGSSLVFVAAACPHRVRQGPRAVAYPNDQPCMGKGTARVQGCPSPASATLILIWALGAQRPSR